MPTSTIELTVTDASLSPLSGLQVHGFATVGEEEYHGFAATDGEGVMRLPAVPGNWALHVKAESLAAHGMKELPIIEVNVDGASVAISRQAMPFAVDRPQLAVALGENRSFQFHGAGDTGRTCGIEASTDLKNWYEIGVVRPMADSFEVEDRSGRREVFYRVAGQ